jgi:anti-sigma factor RsiW
MSTSRHLELIHAEIDGELDAHGRGELARQLLADPALRLVRDQLHELCAHLDRLDQDEPPAELPAKILGALPPAAVPRTPYGRSMPRWRYAALIAGVLAAGAVVFESVRGPEPATSEMTGTMAAADAPALDAAILGSGPISGRVSLFRDGTGLSVALELAASAPVDVLVASDGHTLIIKGLGNASGASRPRIVALPGPGVKGQVVGLTFLMAGRQVSTATLRVP